ncbi:MAG: SgcJ/EcaC family oxidoreductase [Gemmatimonadota bacterium]|nr:SgcJ/EcaC family oxidoreductase [Gemmatimonadota bacterium]
MKYGKRISLIALAIAAIAPTARAQQRDANAIRALSDQWQKDIAAQNVDRIVGLHAPDAVVMMSNSPLATGSTAIRGMYGEMVKTPGLSLHWTPTRIDVASPTTATEYGTYTMSYNTPQGRMSDGGNYVTIWHKVNGQWRVALDAPVSTAAMPAPVTDPSTMDMRSGSGLTWGDLTAPGFAPGAKISVLHGNPGGPGVFVLRLQFPDGYMIPVHWHPTGESVTVVSGSVGLGMGNAFDASGLHTYNQGDFAYLPPNQSHYGQAHAPTIVEVSGRGPFAINPGPAK